MMYTAEDKRKSTDKAQRLCEARDILGNLFNNLCAENLEEGICSIFFANFSRTSSSWCSEPNSSNVFEYVTNIPRSIAMPYKDLERRQASFVRTLMQRYCNKKILNSRAVIEMNSGK